MQAMGGGLLNGPVYSQGVMYKLPKNACQHLNVTCKLMRATTWIEKSSRALLAIHLVHKLCKNMTIMQKVTWIEFGKY